MADSIRLQPCQFPASTKEHLASIRMQSVDVQVDERVSFAAAQHHVSKFQILQTAWAILLRTYLGNDTVSFGVLPIRQDDSMVSHQLWLARFTESSEAMACQLQLSDGDSVISAVQWASITKYPRAAFDVSEINTALTLPLSYPSKHRHCEMNHYLKHLRGRTLSTFDILVNISEDDTGIEATVNYRHPTISTETACNLAASYEQILLEMAIKMNSKIGEIDCISKRDLYHIRKWNNRKLNPQLKCVHHVIEAFSISQPHSTAVCSWDGDLTYSQLDEYSSGVAKGLVASGVGPGIFVPFCFEKSKWAIVATLAILKAGGAFVPLDPDHPKARTVEILLSVKAKVMLTSWMHARLFEGLIEEIIILSASSIRMLSQNNGDFFSSPSVCFTDPAFLLFTSGSTGRPKGIIQEHWSVCSNAIAHGEVMHYRKTSRVLQFAAHTFDVAQMDIFTTLLHGGCVCIPSEDDRRNDITGAMSRMKVNWALLTPSFASLIHPHEVPTLKTLALGGEALTQESCNRWASKVMLSNCYGPAECGACLTMEIVPTHGRPETVGFPLPNSICWLINPDNHDKLVPIGAVGELLVEGPNLARGYLNDPEKTDTSFIDNPIWASGTEPRRFYKTGDLLKLNIDGSMDFVGRKDTQIKLRGQRVELGEVEHHLSTISRIAVSMVTSPATGCYANKLVAVVQLRDHKANPVGLPDASILLDHETPFSLEDVKSHLGTFLPGYMIPNVCLVVQNIPFSTSLKVNRKLVAAWLGALESRPICDLVPAVGKDTRLHHSESTALLISDRIVELVSKNDQVRRSVLQGCDFPLKSAGLDSIQVISLSMFLQKVFLVRLPMALLLSSQTTIRDLAQYTEGGGSSLHGPENFGVSTIKEVTELSAQLGSSMAANPLLPPNIRKPAIRNIFLTGATGFLGTHILKELLSSSDAFVTALVRAQDTQEGLGRVVEAACAARWWKSEYCWRLKIWIGDLSLPQLGLSKIHWQQLTGQCHLEHAIDVIIHNGARVHWNSDYSSLKAANVLSTFQLLESASSSPTLSDFAFVSGGQLPNEDEGEVGTEGAEGAFHPKHNGYSQSKLVSELLVKQYAELLEGKISSRTSQQKISIIKPGYVIGTTTDGIANKSDFIWRLVAACIDIHAHADVDIKSWLFVTDVQRVASAVVSQVLAPKSDSTEELSPSSDIVSTEKDLADGSSQTGRELRASSQNGTDNLSITRILDGLPLQRFWDIISKDFGYILQALPHDEWYSRVQAAVVETGESHVFFPLLHTIDSVKNENPPQAKSNDKPTPTMSMETAGSEDNMEGVHTTSSGNEPCDEIGKSPPHSGDSIGSSSDVRLVSEGQADPTVKRVPGADHGVHRDASMWLAVEAALRKNLEYLIQVGFLPSPPGCG